MKPTELRIGNLIQLNPNKEWYGSGDQIVTIESISEKGINYQHFPYEGDLFWDSLDDDRFAPIPITEKWLIRFGFEESNDLKNLWIKNGISILEKGITEKKFYDFLFNDNCEQGTADAVSLRWVHQLQNLYFALTGEELKISE